MLRNNVDNENIEDKREIQNSKLNSKTKKDTTSKKNQILIKQKKSLSYKSVVTSQRIGKIILREIIWNKYLQYKKLN